MRQDSQDICSSHTDSSMRKEKERRAASTMEGYLQSGPHSNWLTFEKLKFQKKTRKSDVGHLQHWCDRCQRPVTRERQRGHVYYQATHVNSTFIYDCTKSKHFFFTNLEKMIYFLWSGKETIFFWNSEKKLFFLNSSAPPPGYLMVCPLLSDIHQQYHFNTNILNKASWQPIFVVLNLSNLPMQNVPVWVL